MFQERICDGGSKTKGTRMPLGMSTTKRSTMPLEDTCD
jgi:hypothetical protein